MYYLTVVDLASARREQVRVDGHYVAALAEARKRRPERGYVEIRDRIDAKPVRIVRR